MSAAAFGVCAMASAAIVLMHWGQIYLSRKYAPLRIRSNGIDNWMVFFAIVHIWTALITYDAQMAAVRLTACRVWTLWLHLFVGLQGWIACMLLRVIHQGEGLNVKMRNYDTCQRITIRMPFIIGMIIWGILCGVVSVDDETCTTETLGKGIIIGWAALWLMYFVSLSVYVYWRTPRHSQNYVQPTRDCAIISAVSLIITATIHASMPRIADAVPILFALMHVIVEVRLHGYALWKGLRNDREYANWFVSSPLVFDMAHVSVLSLEHDREAMTAFVARVALDTEPIDVNGIMYRGDRVAELYEHLCAWARIRAAGNPNGDEDYLRQTIFQDYIEADVDPSKRVCLPVTQHDSPECLRFFLLQVMHIGWGVRFLSKMSRTKRTTALADLAESGSDEHTVRRNPGQGHIRTPSSSSSSSSEIIYAELDVFKPQDD